MTTRRRPTNDERSVRTYALRAARRRYDDAEAAAETARHLRRDQVLLALEVGMTHDEVASELGVNRSRVGQIVRGRESGRGSGRA